MPPLPADSIHARACKLKCEKILTRPFQECPSFLFVPILFSASQLISLEVAAISQTVAFSA